MARARKPDPFAAPSFQVWTWNESPGSAQHRRGLYPSLDSAIERADFECDGKRSFKIAVVLDPSGREVYRTKGSVV